MVKRGRRDGPYNLSLDVAVGRAKVEQLKDDKKTFLATTLTLLKDGLDTVVTEILGKSWFDGLDM